MNEKNYPSLLVIKINRKIKKAKKTLRIINNLEKKLYKK